MYILNINFRNIIMALIPKSRIKDISIVSENEKLRIIDFLQGALFCWIKNRPNEWFSMRDLMGGENNNWDRTPLQILYDKHWAKCKNDKKAYDYAGKDSGWLLKRVINEDIRSFDTITKDRIRQYKLK
jgi:hypothetical protein